MQLKNLPRPEDMRDADCVAKREELRRKRPLDQQSRVFLEELDQHLVNRRLLQTLNGMGGQHRLLETPGYRRYKALLPSEGHG